LGCYGDAKRQALLIIALIAALQCLLSSRFYLLAGLFFVDAILIFNKSDDQIHPELN
jgi:hypothetical protein